MNNYYKLKSTYENAYSKEKTKIIENKQLSWKEKKAEFKRLKPKCIQCKRSVGTKFTRTYNESEFTYVLKAFCGDIQNPCSLNIVIHTGYYDSIPSIIQSDEKDIEEAKIGIIKDKNNMLFGYITTEEALKNFDDFKKMIVDTGGSLEVLLSDTSKKEKKIELRKSEIESYAIIEKIKKMIHEYEKTNNTQFVNDAVEIYVNQLKPKLSEQMKLKYLSNRVDYYEDDSTFHLIQEEDTIASLEFDYGKPEVVKYDFGLIQHDNKK